MTLPPDIPSQKNKKPIILFLILGGIAAFIILVTVVVFAVRYISDHGLTEPMDRVFGDQNLKTTVALLELHKLRFGQYPESLGDLKYTGEWDQIHLRGMRYYPSDDRKFYYVEVERGWVGKPNLVMPKEFWQNTGYDERLKPKTE